MLRRILHIDGPFHHGRPTSAGMYRQLELEDLNSIVLERLMARMPLLEKVFMQVDRFSPIDIDRVNAVPPLSILLAIMKNTRVRHFSISAQMCNPDDPVLERFRMNLSHVLSFKYYLYELRSPQRRYRSEAALLKILVPKLHRSVQELVLPVENVPLLRLSRKDWPCLRELSLYGGLEKPLTTPYISIFGRMPKLRILNLRLACPLGYDPQPVWPRGLPMVFPWPELGSLTVTNPHVDDQLWEHLPPDMQFLGIQCYPRLWQVQNGALCTKHTPEGQLKWHSPVPSASGVLRLLRFCRTPRLRHLQIEYRADGSEEALLLHLVSAFPCLEILEICRYRAVDPPGLALVRNP